MKQFLFSAALAVILAGCSAGSSQTNAPPAPSVVSFSGQTAGTQINGIRAQVSLPALKRNGKLERAALAHAQDMAAKQFMSHTGSDGSSMQKRAKRAGYKWCTLAENVSRGYRSDASAIEGWRTSPGHYKNMTKRKAREYGYANVNGFRVLLVGAQRC